MGAEQFCKAKAQCYTIRREQRGAEPSTITDVFYQLLGKESVPRHWAEIISQHGEDSDVPNLSHSARSL